MPLTKSVTLHDVAEAAGVSLITASRAIRTPDAVAKATLVRIQRAVRETGYIPNMLAGGLKSKKSMTIGALVPYIAVPQFLPTMQTLTEELDRAGYQLVMGQTGYDHAREVALLETMLSRRVDGIVVAGLLQSSAAAERLERLAVPVVETWDLSDRPLDMQVGFSHVDVGAAVAEFFRKKGWKRFGVATGDDERARRRSEAFLAAVGRDVPTAFVKAPSNLGLGRAAMRELLQRDLKLQAVFCSSDGLANGVMTEARSRGLRIPQDVAVVGFGDAEFAAFLEPSLTTVRIDAAAIGRHASRHILARCRGQDVAEPVINVGFEIIERQSTAT